MPATRSRRPAPIDPPSPSRPEAVLFLEDLDVDRARVEELLAATGHPFRAAWPNGEDPPDPQEVFALVTVRTRVDEALLGTFPGAKLVAVAFTGYDAVDLDACRARGVAVANVPGYATDSTAELAVALTLGVLRQIPAAHQGVAGGGWKLPEPGRELAGKPVGVVGTGTVGLRAAALFRAFGCALFGWSRTPKQEFLDLGGEYLPDLGSLFGKVEIVSIHLPLTGETEGIIGAELLAELRPSAVLVNTSRGGVIDQDALVDALATGRFAGAGLDVLAEEPPAEDDPIRRQPRVILTPHLGYRTREALERRAAVTVENLKAFVEGRKLNRVL